MNDDTLVSAERARDLLAGWAHGSLSHDPPEEDGGGCPVYSETTGAVLAMVDAPEVARMFAAAPDLARTVIAQVKELAENATEIERLRSLLDAEEMRQYASDPKVHAQLAAENERLDEMRRLVFARNAELTAERDALRAEVAAAFDRGAERYREAFAREYALLREVRDFAADAVARSISAKATEAPGER